MTKTSRQLDADIKEALRPVPDPLWRGVEPRMLARVEHVAIQNVIHAIERATSRVGYATETQVVFDPDTGASTEFGSDALLTLLRAGLAETYPGSRGSRRVRLTKLGQTYAAQTRA